MGTAPFCDRCKAIGVQLVPVLGVDLCNECVAEFPEWVVAGRKRRVQRTVSRGQWERTLVDLARRKGVITPDDVAKACACPRDRAQWQCNYQVRRGVLTRLPGAQPRYCVAARQEAAE